MSDQQVVVYSPTIGRNAIELHYMIMWGLFVSAIVKKCEQMMAYGTPPNVFLPTIDEHYTEGVVWGNAKCRRALLVWWIAALTMYRSDLAVWLQNTAAMDREYPACIATCVFFEDQDLAKQFGIYYFINRNGRREVFVRGRDDKSKCKSICKAIAALAAKWEIPTDTDRIDFKAVYERYHGGAGS